MWSVQNAVQRFEFDREEFAITGNFVLKSLDPFGELFDIFYSGLFFVLEKARKVVERIDSQEEHRV